jgi:molecular chaperone DnaK (HSP70)
MSVVVPRNSLLPCTVEKNYTNSHANMSVLSIDVYEGLSDQIINNRYLRKHDVVLAPAPAGSTLIKLTFKYNAYGELQISHQIDGPGQEIMQNDGKHFQYEEVKEEFRMQMPQIEAPLTGKVCKKAFGVAMPDETIDVIVPKDTPLPCRKETQYSNNMDGQTEFEIEIYEGNGEYKGDNKFVKTMKMRMNPCPRGTAMITVIFEVDEAGKLTTSHTVAGEGQAAQGNVIAEDVGIELGNGSMSVIIPKGTPYPCSQLKAYTNQSAEQDVFSITVFQGNMPMAR